VAEGEGSPSLATIEAELAAIEAAQEGDPDALRRVAQFQQLTTRKSDSPPLTAYKSGSPPLTSRGRQHSPPLTSRQSYPPPSSPEVVVTVRDTPESSPDTLEGKPSVDVDTDGPSLAGAEQPSLSPLRRVINALSSVAVPSTAEPATDAPAPSSPEVTLHVAESSADSFNKGRSTSPSFSSRKGGRESPGMST
jgi:hypothetical protein